MLVTDQDEVSLLEVRNVTLSEPVEVRGMTLIPADSDDGDQQADG